MSLRAPRVVRAALVGGLVLGVTLIGSGTAGAAPEPTDPPPVPARCGQTVEAAPDQTVRVTPALGLPFLVPVEEDMDPIRRSVAGVLCRVDVEVVEPVTSAAAEAAPPLRPVTKAADQAADTASSAVDPSPETADATAPTPEPAAAPAAPPLTPTQASAAAPAFAPAFGDLPASFLRDATGPAPAAQYDPRMLLGSAFGGLHAGAPAYLGLEPASAVTTASQIQALPLDGLAQGGVGLPSVLAVLALSGVAAFVVRRLALGRRHRPVAAPVTPVPGSPDGVDELDEDAPRIGEHRELLAH